MGWIVPRRCGEVIVISEAFVEVDVEISKKRLEENITVKEQ